MTSRLIRYLSSSCLLCLGMVFSVAALAQFAPGQQQISTDFPFQEHYVEVLGSRMHTIDQGDVVWLQENLSEFRVVNIAPDQHFVQEDSPHAIGEALIEWLSSLDSSESASTEIMEEIYAGFVMLLDDHLIELRTQEGGLVTAFDYEQALASTETLQRLTWQKKRLSEFDIQQLDTRESAIAFWVNAYNFFMLAQILEDRPGGELVDSVWDYGGRYNPFRDSVFTRDAFDVGGRLYSLDTMEKAILLGPEFAEKGWFDARVHFAVNCASVGCPPLRREIYKTSKLDSQLTDNTRLSFSTPRHLLVEGATVYLSSLFDWYAKDFIGEFGNILDFVKEYATDQVASSLPESPRIRYIDYDWLLNRPGNFLEFQGL